MCWAGHVVYSKGSQKKIRLYDRKALAKEETQHILVEGLEEEYLEITDSALGTSTNILTYHGIMIRFSKLSFSDFTRNQLLANF
jgi:hypothetical protein